jgi:hypothetical protein
MGGVKKSLPANREPRRVRKDESGSSVEFLCAALKKPDKHGFFSIDMGSLSTFSNPDKIDVLQCIMTSQLKKGREVAANLTLPLPLIVDFRLDGLNIRSTAIPIMPSTETPIPHFGYNLMASGNRFIGSLATVTNSDLMNLDVQSSTVSGTMEPLATSAKLETLVLRGIFA